jgi:hypothetical protein
MYGARDAITSMLAGVGCEGAIVAVPEAAWVMGVNDTNGDLCGAVPVGSPVGDEAVPLTFSLNALSSAQLDVINLAILVMRMDGSYLEPLKASFFPTGARQVCAQEDADASAALASLAPGLPLAPIDLAGAFIMQAIGVCLGALLHMSKNVRRRASAALLMTGRINVAASAGGAEEDQSQEDLPKVVRSDSVLLTAAVTAHSE